MTEPTKESPTSTNSAPTLVKYHDARELYSDLQQARVMARELVEFCEQMCDRWHEAVMTAPTGASVSGVTPPVSPPVKGFRASDSVRALAALGVGGLGIGLALACGSRERCESEPSSFLQRGAVEEMSAQNSSAAGLAALRRGDFKTAERDFVAAGDDIRTGEALFGQERYDEAALLLERHLGDKTARFLLGRIAAKRKDFTSAERLLNEAKEMGSFEAKQLLKVKNWMEII